MHDACWRRMSDWVPCFAMMWVVLHARLGSGLRLSCWGQLGRVVSSARVRKLRSHWLHAGIGNAVSLHEVKGGRRDALAGVGVVAVTESRGEV